MVAGVKTRRARWLRRLSIALGASLASVIALWVAIHRVPGFGPWLADRGRSVLGVNAVARIEAFAYGVEDRLRRLARSGTAPEAAWELPAPRASATPPPGDAGSDAPPPPPPWRPKDVGALHPKVATPVDGVWVPVVDPRHPEAPPLLWKTQLHPDKTRPWAALFVVALEVAKVELHLVTGIVDPKPTTSAGREAKRPGRIDPAHRGRLLAAFNGGFKTEHGNYGLRTAGVTFVPARAISCTIAAYDDGTLRVGTWKALADAEARMRFWRGTPPCLFESGKRHASLWDEETRGWGAALEGETVIRRSALGLSASRDVLYVGLGDHTTARALADGMSHAGADAVAQLDVNYSFPKLVLFSEPTPGKLEAETLFKGFVFEKDDYAERASPRDFFYLTRRD
ncbi:MAG: hypothetical protein IPM35_30890 [Myxococcales bacterium]|nr:hypothetical protein [Myxococcales bacterium]